MRVQTIQSGKVATAAIMSPFSDSRMLLIHKILEPVMFQYANAGRALKVL